jgi:hypothetical protein
MTTDTTRVMRMLGLMTMLLAGCAERESDVPEAPLGVSEQDIVQGYAIGAGTHPYAGALIERTSNLWWVSYHFFCSGTLIAPTVVLTAAHCADTPNTYFTLKANAEDINGASERKRVTWKVVHPQYNATTHHHDLALMFLEAPPGGSTIRIPTPAVDTSLAYYRYLDLVGYGDTQTGGGGSVGRKYTGYSYVWEMQAFEMLLPSISDPPRVPFAGSPAATCHGDSGGPAIAYDNNVPYVVGVTSRPANAPYDCTQRTIDTRVGAHLMWIHQHTSLACDSGLPCDQRCGDWQCDPAFEDWTTCSDCAPPPQGPVCDDGFCDTPQGENSCDCPQDCYCPPGQFCPC